MRLVFLKLACFMVLLSGFRAEILRAQEPERSKLPDGWTRLEPFREDLVAIDFPDLNHAEEVVRNQIMRFRSSLVTLIEKAPNASLELSNAYGLLGSVCYAYQMRATAESCFQNAVTLQPNEFRWNYILAMLNMEQGDSEEAIQLLQKAAESKADYGPLWTTLGDLHLSFNRTQEARASYQKSLEINKQSSAAMFGMGQVAMMEDQAEAAVEWFEKVLALVPQANRIHYLLGTAWRKLGDKEKARHHLSLSGKVGVKEADPLMEDLQRFLRGERVHMIRGKTAFSAGRYGDAVDEYTRAVKSKPDSLRARINLGTALGMQGRSDEAIVQFQEALKLDAENVNAHYNLGQMLLGQGRWQEAMTHLSVVVAAAPGDQTARLALVTALKNLGKLEDAMAHMARIAGEGPLNESSLMLLVELQLLGLNEPAAHASLMEGHQRFPDALQVSHRLARFLASCNDRSLRDGATAVALATKVLQAAATVDHAVTLAMAYAESGDCKAAAELQAQVVAALTEQESAEAVALMKQYLDHYQNSDPCRL